MIRKLITACAGVALMTSGALAIDATGTYDGQSNGQHISIQLQEQGGMVRGVVRTGGAQLPLAGQEQNGEIRGGWQTPDGQQVPFAARVDGGKLQLQTNGATYSLDSGGRATDDNEPDEADRHQPAPIEQPQQADVEPRQEDAGMPARPNAGGMRPMTVRMEQGQIFARPVPQGWKGSESINETFVVSPDNRQSFGFTGLEGLTPMSPTQFIQWMLGTVYKHQNVQIVQQHEVASPEGGKTVEAIVTFNDNGVQWKSWIRCNVLTAYNSSNGYILFATASPQEFNNAAPALIEMAQKIQITDVNAVFDRTRRLGVIRSIKNNPIPDTIIVGYNGRQKIMDDISFRRGEVDTDTYHVHTEGGEGEYVPNRVIDSTTGTYTDPRTGQVYHLDPRWNGHY